jgi:L-asparaginase II
MRHPKDPELAREAKAIVALAFRNGPIEKVHAGKLCPTCSAGPEYSRITDDEMKAIMKSAVNRMYTLLLLKSGDPEEYARQITFGAGYVTQWDEPAEPSA